MWTSVSVYALPSKPQHPQWNDQKGSMVFQGSLTWSFQGMRPVERENIDHYPRMYEEHQMMNVSRTRQTRQSNASNFDLLWSPNQWRWQWRVVLTIDMNQADCADMERTELHGLINLEKI